MIGCCCDCTGCPGSPSLCSSALGALGLKAVGFERGERPETVVGGLEIFRGGKGGAFSGIEGEMKGLFSSSNAESRSSGSKAGAGGAGGTDDWFATSLLDAAPCAGSCSLILLLLLLLSLLLPICCC